MPTLVVRGGCGADASTGSLTSWRFEPRVGADDGGGSGGRSGGGPPVGMLRSGDVCLDTRGQLPAGHEASNHLHALPCDASQPTQRWAFNGTGGTIQSAAAARWQQQQQQQQTAVVEQRGGVVEGGGGGAPCLRVLLHWLWDYVPLVDTVACNGDAPQPPARNEQWVLDANGTLRNAQFGCIEVSANSGPPSTIWAKPLHDGAVALLAINGADMPQTFDLDLGELLVGQGGRQQKQWRARDVWAAADLGTIGLLTRSVPPHDCILLVLSPI